ncbi:hypothetical protein SLEP1_g26881 [Rubroshorea leprosula]|uniref:UPF3 domain-containing protein n=1 Tax=Rubroshorea leprosula TaxID=152421 RepID=A0AAV5JVL8_9ROSI|nr:hypothetical protein SLEP1_g26881 [Rubroshorea leprosula]
MKDPLRRTKVVLRHLPPSLGQADLLAQIDDRFRNRYNWFSFRPGKSSHKHQRYSRAYIDFKNPEDVFEFAEFFDGHVFVNEKGTQLKAIVEYSPSQRVPKPCSKRDGREGTIFKDPDYLEFLKLIAKPVENLPSAEVQLERKEAELSNAAKEIPIITPLMEFVRQKRAAKNGIQRSVTTGKVRRSGATSKGKAGVSATKRSSEKKKYVLKDGAKSSSRKDKSNFVVMSRRKDKSVISSVCSIDTPVTGVTLTSESGKKKILLLKPKDREAPHDAVSPVTNSSTSPALGQNRSREAGGRLIRSILLNNEASQSSAAAQPQQKAQTIGLEYIKRPPRPSNTQLGMNGHVTNNEPSSFGSDVDSKRMSDDRFGKKEKHSLGSTGEKHEKRTRNKDRPDRGVWAPLRRADFPQAKEHCSHALQSSQLPSDSVEVTLGEMKGDIPHGSSGRNGHSVENGSHQHFGWRIGAQSLKDDGSAISTEVKSSKRGGAAGGGGVHEKQVWVQKSSAS